MTLSPLDTTPQHNLSASAVSHEVILVNLKKFLEASLKGLNNVKKSYVKGKESAFFRS